MISHPQPRFVAKDRSGRRYCCLAFARVQYHRSVSGPKSFSKAPIEAFCGIYVSTRRVGKRFHLIVYTLQNEWLAWFSVVHGDSVASALLNAMVDYRILPSAWRLCIPDKGIRLPSVYKKARTAFAQETQLYRLCSSGKGNGYQRYLENPIFSMHPKAGFNDFGRTRAEDELFDKVVRKGTNGGGKRVKS